MKVFNKTIIVTGAGNGIGRELTLELLKKGASIIGIDISKEGLEETKKIANSDKLMTYVVDIASDDALNNFRNILSEESKVIDGLINNAGIIQPFINVNELDLKVLDKIMNINFFGPYKLTKMFLPELLTRPEAHIINISSMGGFFPFPGQTAYSASKAALKLFTEGLYSELLNTNVHVTIVFPGAIATNIAKNSNVEIKTNSENANYKMTLASDAAKQIIKGIEKNNFQIYVGSDSKFMHFIYKMNPEKAIKFINKKINLK